MFVRLAGVDDAAAIAEIAKSLRNGREKTGFIRNPLSVSEYAIMTQVSPLFYVAQIKGVIAGYLMAFSKKDYGNLVRYGALAQTDDGIIKYLLDQEDSFVYCDQVGVKKSLWNTQPGELMLSKLAKDSARKGYDRIVGAISVRPVNAAGRKFAETAGAKLVRLVYNSDDSICGMFELKLKNKD